MGVCLTGLTDAWGQRLNSAWTVSDNVAIQALASGYYNDYTPAHAFQYDLSGTRVAFITLESFISTNAIRARLRVYEVAQLKRFASGKSRVATPLLDFSADSSPQDRGWFRPPIRGASWSVDGMLYFLRQRQGIPELMRWRVGDAVPQLLAERPGGVWRYHLLGTRYIALLTPFDPRQSQRTGARSREPMVIRSNDIYPVLQALDDGPAEESYWGANTLALIDLQTRRVRTFQGILIPSWADMYLSPPGNKVAFVEPFRARLVGSCWSSIGQDDPDSFYFNPMRASFGARIVVVDLLTGASIRPYQAPVGELGSTQSGSAPEVIWSQDGSRLLAPNTFIAGDECSSAGSRRVAPSAYVADLKSGNLQRNEQWSSDSGWKQAASNAALSKPNALVVWSEYNTLPAIYASDPAGGRRMLIDLAREMRNRVLGRVERFDWQDAAGHSWRGVLAYPANYERGRLYPLLIQTHGEDLLAEDPQPFFAEGSIATAYPGRAATSSGFVVLTLAEPGIVDRSVEGAAMLQGYRALIVRLASLRIIDPQKVGIIGFSATSSPVKYALTHDPQLFAAAVAADGVDYGYLGYLFNDAPTGEAGNQFDVKYGGGPWGNWQRWRDAPGFSLDRVRTPLLEISKALPSMIFGEWEIYSGLKHLQRPVELVLYPDGGHPFRLPLHRVHSQEITLDWMDYWINGVEHGGSGNRLQYERWDQMRTVAAGS